MKVGIVGLGFRLGYLARVFTAQHDDFTVVGYVDPHPAGLAYTEEHGIAVGRSYPSLDAMLDAEDLDLLMVGSPNHLHLEHIRIGLERGLKIFTEKPVVTSVDETLALARLISLSERGGRRAHQVGRVVLLRVEHVLGEAVDGHRLHRDRPRRHPLGRHDHRLGGIHAQPRHGIRSHRGQQDRQFTRRRLPHLGDAREPVDDALRHHDVAEEPHHTGARSDRACGRQDGGPGVRRGSGVDAHDPPGVLIGQGTRHGPGGRHLGW